MRRALLVGIDHYDKFSALSGCVNDVAALEPVLARREDGYPNFTSDLPGQPGDARPAPAGRGVFSTYLYDALGGADIRGQVTVASVYAYLDESFGPWDQRPMFKANVERL